MEKKRILIISNQCLSNDTSNGRTLINFLPKNQEYEVLNLYISGNPLNKETYSFLHVGDSFALRAFLTFGLAKNKQPSSSGASEVVSNKNQKTPFKMFCRNLVWNSLLWYNKETKKAINTFNPNEVLLFAGDSSFFIRFARKISKQFNCKLVLFTTEDYCIKKHNYLNKKKSLWFSAFLSNLKKEYRKVFRDASSSVFNTEFLCEDICKDYFVANPSVIYQKSKLIPCCLNQKRTKIIYAGNLGVGRIDSLIYFAKAVKNIKPEATIDVYSKLNSIQKEQLCEIDNIIVHNPIPYDDLIQLYSKYGLLIHIESFDAYYSIDLKHAFSTKISDCLMTHIPFLIFAPKDMAETKYLLKNNPDWVITSKEDLNDKLAILLEDDFQYSPNYVQINKDLLA